MKLSFAVVCAFVCLLVIGSAGIADGQTWTSMTNVPPVSFGAMLLLTDGRVLVHEEPNCSGSTCKGKDYTAWYTLTPDINGSYINGTWTQVASTPAGYAPLFFASAVLPDGKVVVQGGEYQCAAGSCADAWQSNGALFDPVANSWASTAPPLPSNLEDFGDAQSVVLPNGTWMVAACCAQFGGYTTFPDYFYFNESALNFTTEAYAGDGGTSEFDEGGWNLLPNGKVLMVDAYLGSFNPTGMNSEIYDPSTNSWSSAGSTQVQLWDDGCGNSATASYELGPGMLMPGNGTVFYTGASNCQAAYMASYNYTTGVWTSLGQFPGKGSANDAPGATEINGNAIVMTSPYTNTFSSPSQFYEWNGTTLSTFPNPINAAKDDSYLGHLLVLPTGQMLFSDFSTTGMQVLTSAGTYQAAWQPTITTAPSSLSIGQTYSIAGTQFNGVSTGAFYGDDYQDNTNYPLVRIVNNGTGHVFYARTHDHSTMGVATGSTPVSTNFDVPVMETGACQLYVVANGIPSAASACTVGQPSGIYSPVKGTTLGSTSVTFQWGGDANATAYWLDIGSTQGGNNYYSSGSLSTSTLSQAVTSLPSNGSTVWVRWYELVSGTWQPTDYSYTAIGGAATKGSVNTPVPGVSLTSTSQAFTWSAGAGATSYWLTVGSTAGGSNYYSSGSLGNVVTVTATGLPNDGSALYVTLYSLVGGAWLSNAYNYTAFNVSGASGPVMSTPTPGSTLTGSSQVFTWAALSGVTSYWLDAGSTAGAHNYYSSGVISKNTRTATAKGLPTNGSTIYITLYGLVGGTYIPSAYTYIAYNPAAAGGIMQTPASGSTLTGSSVTFTWLAGSGASGYWVDAGSTAGAHNYSSSGNLGNVLTTTVNGLPTDGSTVYVTLYSLIGTTWTGNAYTYTALNATGGLAVMQSPVPNTTLSTNAATFTWSSDANATAYWLDIGTAPNGNTIYSSGNLGAALTTSVNSLPADGSTIYVTLYSYVGGQWLNNAYTYVSGP